MASCLSHAQDPVTPLIAPTNLTFIIFSSVWLVVIPDVLVSSDNQNLRVQCTTNPLSKKFLFFSEEIQKIIKFMGFCELPVHLGFECE